ncbi:serine/threonine protein kinase [Streptomyces sp. S3(2020)]|uniref:serine/threonine-protein kinase n=1 Tax=Streptomyces sp. S3(2020) TaxID=2732044 RepID=UPI001489F1F5|nr:serine/threonine-protein kinase [Streptomyces sp. S3(2020)]NNN36808.1 serine/threonine protein kinase [Streptomyces sp. S3(2020)]
MHSVERIGRYRIERPLGTGTFGTVWLAHDDTLDAPVAVKVLAENWSHRPDIRERFLSQARLLRGAGSRHVVQVYDIGELPDGRPYFVMEYADGGTLADLLDDGPLPVPRALRLTALAARAAAALHEAGIAHGDVRPSSLLLRTGADGAWEVLLADLGQAEPGAGIDVRADVYSLGAVGYHLVTGTAPGAPGKVVRPDRLRPGLDPGVRRALMRALRPDGDRRPDARAFAEELERLATGPRPRRRHHRWLGLAVGVGLAGVAFTLTDRESAPTELRIEDATGRVEAVVPATWAGQVHGSGWDPRVLGLPAGHQPGFAVADDLARWQDLGADVDGIFVGLAGQGDVTALVNALAHPGCHYDGARDHTLSVWHGRVRTWSDCPGGGSVVEAGLTPPDGGGQPQLYVQIRQQGEPSGIRRVLGSVRVRG